MGDGICTIEVRDQTTQKTRKFAVRAADRVDVLLLRAATSFGMVKPSFFHAYI